MRLWPVIATILFGISVAGQEASLPTLRQRMAHVLSAETHRSHHSTSVYNPTTGQNSYGGGNSVERDTEIQIGNLVYESPQIHKEVQVGKDYPVTIELDKHGNAKQLALTVGGKTYTYKITGTREVRSN